MAWYQAWANRIYSANEFNLLTSFLDTLNSKYKLREERLPKFITIHIISLFYLRNHAY